MLIQFTIRNFKTFKERTTLNLIASNYDKETRESENVADIPDYNLRLLKSSVIFGANASGKSKFIDALMFMRNFVISSSKDTQKGEFINVIPFLLNSETENSGSEFEVIFIYQNEMYRYGFEVTNKEIIGEWLFHKPKTKEIQLFFRDYQDFELHPKGFSKGKTLVKDDMIRKNALMISTAAQFNDEKAESVLNWFRGLSTISGLNEMQYKNISINKIKDPKNKNLILEFLSSADLGINDIRYEAFDDSHLPEDFKSKIKVFRDTIKDFDTEAFSEIKTSHTKYDQENKRIGNVEFSMLLDESMGTKKFFYLSGLILDTLENGHILIIDELDSTLHPNLVCKIVSLFNSKELNPNNAQVVFNTHDTNLLSSGLFRRDQIWFIEKDKYGASKLYSLADFKTDELRKNEAFEDNYIKGKYGAIPFLGNFELLTRDLLLRYEDAK